MTVRRSLFRWLRRLFTWLALIVATGVVVLAGAYLGGVRLPIAGGHAPLTFENWTGTREVSARLGYRGSVERRDGRVFVTARLAMPESVRVLHDWLDGGRRLIVECGPQKLYLQRLEDARISVEKPMVRLAGTVRMDLAGPVELAGTFPVRASVRTGFDRTTLWAKLDRLDIEGVPPPMTDAIVDQAPRKVWTREQVLDLATGALSDTLASALARHRDELDLAFEDVTPRMEGDRLHVDATFSVDESAVFGLLADQIAAASDAGGRAVAALAGVTPAHAQIPGFGDLGKALEGAARDVQKQLRGGGNPAEILGRTLTGLADCRTAF